MKNKKIILAGGSGFIGQAMAAYFGKENSVIILGRGIANAQNNNFRNQSSNGAMAYNTSYLRWDGKTIDKNWTVALDNADIVINLAGKSVNCRYTEKNKAEIFSSRINATKVIGEAIRQCTVPPKCWINAASATIYRHAEDNAQDEYNGEFKNDFSVEVCKLWEKTFEEERTPFTRKITLRLAITLGLGGVMIPYFNLLKYGLGGRQGNGRQKYSWIHIEDVCRSIEWIYDQKEIEGVYNCCSPEPVTNDFFMHTLRRLTRKKIGLPAYKWMLTVGAWLIGTEKELILKSRWVVPTKLMETGFRFKFGKLEDALKDIIQKTPAKMYALL